MSIVSSSYAVGDEQAGGRHYVTETHVLNFGDPMIVHYLAPANADYQATMNARVSQINEQLADAEVAQIIGTD